MSFRSERKRLAAILGPDEEILASDALCAIEERPELTVLAHPVLVVTTNSAYLILSGQAPEVTRIDVAGLADVMRKDDPVPGSTLRLTTKTGDIFTLTFEPRTRRQITADIITERFFGQVVKDTTDEGAGP